MSSPRSSTAYSASRIGRMSAASVARRAGSGPATGRTHRPEPRATAVRASPADSPGSAPGRTGARSRPRAPTATRSPGGGPDRRRSTRHRLATAPGSGRTRTDSARPPHQLARDRPAGAGAPGGPVARPLGGDRRGGVPGGSADGRRDELDESRRIRASRSSIRARSAAFWAHNTAMTAFASSSVRTFGGFASMSLSLA